MIRNILATALMTVFVTTAAFADTVSVHGSTTVYANVFKPHKQSIENASGVMLRVIVNGSGRGLGDLTAGTADIAMISASLDTLVAKSPKKMPRLADGFQLQAHQVGETRVAFVVHPSNRVRILTMAQIKGILSGSTRNWKEVGGADKPIMTVLESIGGGIRAMVEKTVLGGGSIAGAKREIPNGTLIARIVSQQPNGFGVASIATVNSSVVEVETDRKIVLPLILVTRGAPSPAARKIITAARSVN